MKEKMRNISLITVGVSFFLIIFLGSCTQQKRPSGVESVKNETKYTCPMHPQILEDHPGACPICGMALVKKSGQSSEGAGISLNTVLEPVGSSVIASIGIIQPEQKQSLVEIQGEGYLDFDTRTFNNIAARFSGRIEKLYIKYAFQEIHKGERIFDIYSPEMLTAQQDLLYVVRNSSGETGLINAAKQKLLLLGMTSSQMNQVLKTGKTFYSLPVFSLYNGHVHDMLHSQMGGVINSKPESSVVNNTPLAIREGMYVEKGQNIFNVVDPHHLWAIIKVDPSSVSSLKLNQKVEITLPDLPDKKLVGKVNFIEPILQDGDKRTSIRVYIDNMEHDLKVNSIVHAAIQAGRTSGLWVPKSTVLDLGRSKIVWLKKGSRFKVQQVSAGIQNGDLVNIIEGVAKTDSLALDAHYLMDSEGFIKIENNEKYN
ncbi:Cu(I)/Ag(I) efflux system membrane fusion protein [Pedobacter cryoconitis]|uniref:HlyD family efflux transporter periplasmic adaptor subunit n=1 Tax=Pedobacter cryoconitis TaxID=188932 RepID=UPI001611A39B|nr:HlyD family efflux transporter periplasmic adaptor subunit [Pedobacter cryoconitis]MBB6271787.1 Cu(I)/Ag(I) efflux system membrane fusion protein [Pedobacter cryoconitis]